MVAIRKKLKQEYQASYGVNPTYLAFVARATVDALRDYPWINGELRGDQIVTRSYVNLGFAVELQDGKGLIVPVVKNADSLSLLGTARAVNDLANRARAHKLQPDEVRGGTFTITNHGTTGSLFATPIINQPQCAILGVGMMQKRVVVVTDATGSDSIAIRPMVYLGLTFDHRILDGFSADTFLGKVVDVLENWI